MEQREYNTKQKQMVIDYLEHHPKNHYTADELYLELIKLDQKIGRATIYRALDHFTSIGKIIKFAHSATDSASYQYHDESCDHIHLKCIDCGKLIHAKLKEVDKLDKEAINKFGFVVKPEKIVLYGVCEECYEKNN